MTDICIAIKAFTILIKDAETTLSSYLPVQLSKFLLEYLPVPVSIITDLNIDFLHKCVAWYLGRDFDVIEFIEESHRFLCPEWGWWVTGRDFRVLSKNKVSHGWMHLEPEGLYILLNPAMVNYYISKGVDGDLVLSILYGRSVLQKAKTIQELLNTLLIRVSD